MYYPKEVFNINTNITRMNMKAYDDKQARNEQAILAAYPDYYSYDLRVRMNIREELKIRD